MYDLNDNELLDYIKGDLPYFDLTTYLQDCGDKRARLEIFTRDDIVVACSEEAARVAELLGCEVEAVIPSGEKAKKGEILLVLHGSYERVHQAWRLSQIMLEFSCKMATYANRMKTEIEEVNNHCELLTTRKSFPFAKRFCIKAIMCGGAMPHRLGLSETILLFAGHRIVYENNQAFYKSINAMKIKAPEKKIVVESETVEDAKVLMQSNVDVLQVDKMGIEVLEEIIVYRDKNFPHIKILAAGGVNVGNAQAYAQTGVDGIVTSAIYSSGMADLGSRMQLMNKVL